MSDELADMEVRGGVGLRWDYHASMDPIRYHRLFVCVPRLLHEPGPQDLGKTSLAPQTTTEVVAGAVAGQELDVDGVRGHRRRYRGEKK